MISGEQAAALQNRGRQTRSVLPVGLISLLKRKHDERSSSGRRLRSTVTGLDDYPFEIRSLSYEDGGGYLISYPDFRWCITEGETVEQALANGRDKLQTAI